MTDLIHRCSFCNRTEDEVGPLITGPDGVYICAGCVEAAASVYLKLQKDKVLPEGFFDLKKLLINEPAQNRKKGKTVTVDLIPPKAIKEKLDEFIIGQDKAKSVLSVAVYNHYKRINYKANQKAFPEDVTLKNEGEVELEKTNILMIGPSGTGKSLIARTLAKILNVPFAIADATTLTEAGYVGEDVENILLKLIKAADYDIKRAEKGIVFIDEIDKIAKKSENVSITRDVSGEGVQQALLKIIEGTIASVPPQGGRKHPQQEMYEIDTTDILFICGGAFVGLDKIIERRTGVTSIGFNARPEADKQSYSQLLKDIQPEDLIKFGLIPEFVGRIPVAVSLDALDEDALVRILTEPKNAICRQYKLMFKMDGVDIEFTPEALKAVAAKAIKLETGARGLRAILENVMTKIMFEIPSNDKISKVTITQDCIEKDVEPTIEYKE